MPIGRGRSSRSFIDESDVFGPNEVCELAVDISSHRLRFAMWANTRERPRGGDILEILPLFDAIFLFIT